MSAVPEPSAAPLILIKWPCVQAFPLFPRSLFTPNLPPPCRGSLKLCKQIRWNVPERPCPSPACSRPALLAPWLVGRGPPSQDTTHCQASKHTSVPDSPGGFKSTIGALAGLEMLLLASGGPLSPCVPTWPFLGVRTGKEGALQSLLTGALIPSGHSSPS